MIKSHKPFFCKRSKEVLVIKKSCSTVPWMYVIDDVDGEEVVGTFYEKGLQGKKRNRV